MPSNVYIMEAVNLFAGDHDPSASNHLSLTELKLPDLESPLIEHNPGGGVMAVNFATTMLTALTATFQLRGHDPDRMALFGMGSNQRRTFTAYGVLREKRSNSQLASVAVIEGVITAMRPTNFTRGDGSNHDHEINEIVRYRLRVGGEEVYNIDFFTNRWDVKGIAQNNRMNSILRIPGAGR